MLQESKPIFLEPNNNKLFAHSQPFLLHFKLELATLTKIKPHVPGITRLTENYQYKKT